MAKFTWQNSTDHTHRLLYSCQQIGGRLILQFSFEIPLASQPHFCAFYNDSYNIQHQQQHMGLNTASSHEKFRTLNTNHITEFLLLNNFPYLQIQNNKIYMPPLCTCKVQCTQVALTAPCTYLIHDSCVIGKGPCLSWMEPLSRNISLDVCFCWWVLFFNQRRDLYNHCCVHNDQVDYLSHLKNWSTNPVRHTCTLHCWFGFHPCKHDDESNSSSTSLTTPTEPEGTWNRWSLTTSHVGEWNVIPCCIFCCFVEGKTYWAGKGQC